LYNPPWQSTFCRQSTDYESKDKHCKILKQFCSDTATILAVALQPLCSDSANSLQNLAAMFITVALPPHFSIAVKLTTSQTTTSRHSTGKRTQTQTTFTGKADE